MPSKSTDIRAEDLRAEQARRRVPTYILAARVRLHPVRLGKVLNGRVALTPQLAHRILTVLREHEITKED